jgi:hypothetical protein
VTKVLGIDLGTTNSRWPSPVTARPRGRCRSPRSPVPARSPSAPPCPRSCCCPASTRCASAQLAAAVERTDALRGRHVRARSRRRAAASPGVVGEVVAVQPGDRSHRAVLPWRGAQRELEAEMEGERVSPVNASARYLAHLRAAWDDAHPDEPADEQDVLVTVPASFDAVARELTVVAAREAGFDKVTLLEEPQAAFYAWLAARGDAWRQGARARRRRAGVRRRRRHHRLLADRGRRRRRLARARAGRGRRSHPARRRQHGSRAGRDRQRGRSDRQGKQLDGCSSAAWSTPAGGRRSSCSATSHPESVPISILSRGSKLIGGTVKVEVTREDAAEAMLVDGFFPKVEVRRGRSAARPSVCASSACRTRTIRRSRAPRRVPRAPRQARRRAVLFNGGVMKASKLSARASSSCCARGPAATSRSSRARISISPSRSAPRTTARCAAAKGVRIRGGTARAYYIGIESAMPAIPGFAAAGQGAVRRAAGARGGHHRRAARRRARPSWSASRRPSGSSPSSNRKDDKSGALIDPADADGLAELDPVEKIQVEAERSQAGRSGPGARSTAHVTEVGTLELWCVARDGNGTLEARVLGPRTRVTSSGQFDRTGRPVGTVGSRSKWSNSPGRAVGM